MTALRRPDPDPLRFERRAYDDPLVDALVEVLQADFVRRYGGPDRATVDPAEFSPPRGRFLVGFDAAGAAVAMGGYRLLDPGDAPGPAGAPTAEIKRMWVHPAARRRGYARALLDRLRDDAAAAGVVTLVLNTGGAQPEAVALYESYGFTPVPPFGHYGNTPGALFYGLRLRP